MRTRLLLTVLCFAAALARTADGTPLSRTNEQAEPGEDVGEMRVQSGSVPAVSLGSGAGATLSSDGASDPGVSSLLEVSTHLQDGAGSFPNAGEVIYPWDAIKLKFEDCHGGPAYARSPPANVHVLTNAEKCGLCQIIVENSMMWNWKRHLSALCARVPRHMLPLCRHFACLMAIECPEFITSKCFEDGVERFPCPAKYTCWNCLKLPDKQYAGCFDDRNIPYWLTI